MTTLHCDHRMCLPCDAVTVLMVITCVLIYVIRYRIRPFVLMNYYYTQYMYLLHNICLHLLRCTVYTCSGVAYELIYCIYVYTGVTLMQ